MTLISTMRLLFHPGQSIYILTGVYKSIYALLPVKNNQDISIARIHAHTYTLLTYLCVCLSLSSTHSPSIPVHDKRELLVIVNDKDRHGRQPHRVCVSSNHRHETFRRNDICISLLRLRSAHVCV